MNNYNTINRIIQSSLPIDDSTIQIKYKFKGFKFDSCTESNECFILKYNSNESSDCCSKCNKSISRNKGYRYASVRFGTINNKAIYVQFKKKLFKCLECNSCTVQGTPDTDKYCQHSTTFKNGLIEDLSTNVATYTSVSIEKGTSISTVIRTFDNETKDPDIDTHMLEVINVDETKFIPNLGSYQFVVIDSETNDVITITKDRLKTTVSKLYKDLFPNVRVINQDLWETYRSAAYEAISDNVCIIADPFHVVRQGTWAFNRERRSYMKSKETKLKVEVTWKTLMYSKCKLSDKGRKTIDRKLDKHPRLKVAYQAKEMYYALCKSETPEELNRIANALLRFAKKHELNEFIKALRTIDNWQVEICNSINNKQYSNAISEGVNSLIKQMKRNARGYQNLKRSLKLIQLKNNSVYKVKY